MSYCTYEKKTGVAALRLLHFVGITAAVESLFLGVCEPVPFPQWLLASPGCAAVAPGSSFWQQCCRVGKVQLQHGCTPKRIVFDPWLLLGGWAWFSHLGSVQHSPPATNIKPEHS